MSDLDDCIKHAVMANHDGDLKSICIVMVTQASEPEIHMAVRSDTAFEMNGGVDMLKIEMIKLMNQRCEQRKPRE